MYVSVLYIDMPTENRPPRWTSTDSVRSQTEFVNPGFSDPEPSVRAETEAKMLPFSCEIQATGMPMSPAP